MTQKEAFSAFANDVIFFGQIYKKYGLVQAIIASGGEYIETWTADGLETTNYANQGDFIVKNLQTEWQEMYVVPSNVFFNRYKFFYTTDAGAIYMPTGLVLAVLYHGKNRKFLAPWGRWMELKTGDFLVSTYPACDGIYRIAAKEFYETYDLFSNPDV